MKAIEEFSELGAGFKIAMRDLEIRGAGNILGSEQSGHMEAVGYELYCQLLENAVRAAKKQPLKEHIHVQVDLPVTAYLPHDYVPPGRPKIEAYRKLSSVGSFEELADWQNELRDRFGPLPPLAEKMVELRELQLSAARWGIDRITREDDWLVFGYRDASRLRPLVGQHKGREACGLFPERGRGVRREPGREGHRLLRRIALERGGHYFWKAHYH